MTAAADFSLATAAPAYSQMRRAELFFVACTVFLSPMNYLKASFAYITLGDVFAVISLVLMLANGRLPLRPMGKSSAAWFGCVLLLATGLMLGAILKGDALDGAIVTAQYGFTLVLLPLLLLQRPQGEQLLLIKVWLASMVFVMIHGAYIYHFVPDNVVFVTASGRLATLIERVNEAGTMAAMAIVFSMWLYYYRHISFQAMVLILIPLGYGLLLTASNTGFFLASIGIVALALFSGSPRILLGIVFGGLIFFAVVLQWGELFLPEVFLRRVFGALSSGDLSQAGTFDGRMVLIHEALNIADDTIVVGLGPDQYRVVSPLGAPVHNTYLLILTEGGLLGLLGHVGCLMLSIYIAWPNLLRRETRLTGALTAAVVMMFAIAQNGIPHTYGRFWAVPWLLALGLSLSSTWRADQSGQDQPI